MAYRFVHRRTVAFSDTDLAGIVHFSRFFLYMEDCEHAFYRAEEESVHKMSDGDGGWVGWPRVHVSCDYRKPLRFEDELEIELLVARVGTKTIDYRFQFRRIDGEEVTAVASGKALVACVRCHEGVMEAVEIPQVIRKKIEQAPEGELMKFTD